jgi:uncharacterized alkaline shock family protein YloU
LLSHIKIISSRLSFTAKYFIYKKNGDCGIVVNYIVLKSLKEKIMSLIKEAKKHIDTKELELPDTVFVRDIENRVFQGIILQCLSSVEGISLLEGSFFDYLLRRDNVEGIKGITAEQNSKNQSLVVKVEVNIEYGVSIPEKSAEIQTCIADEITKFTGLHVACIHVVFKNVLLPSTHRQEQEAPMEKEENDTLILDDDLDNNDYGDDF